MCDLAGSEKIKSNQDIHNVHLKELKNINSSLSTLGKVIYTLAHGGSKLPIPYRESKLTRILQDSLQGSTLTYIIATLAPTLVDIEETINTLKFAERARHIQLQIEQNVINSKDDLTIQKLQKELLYLKELLTYKKLGIE